MGAFPNLSRNLPFCPRLSSFVLLGARNRDKSGQKRTNGDKTGHFGTNWETPPFSIYPHLALLKKLALSRKKKTLLKRRGEAGPPPQCMLPRCACTRGNGYQHWAVQALTCTLSILQQEPGSFELHFVKALRIAPSYGLNCRGSRGSARKAPMAQRTH